MFDTPFSHTLVHVPHNDQAGLQVVTYSTLGFTLVRRFTWVTMACANHEVHGLGNGTYGKLGMSVEHGWACKDCGAVPKIMLDHPSRPHFPEQDFLGNIACFTSLDPLQWSLIEALVVENIAQAWHFCFEATKGWTNIDEPMNRKLAQLSGPIGLHAIANNGAAL